jgi:hypothetical protein
MAIWICTNCEETRETSLDDGLFYVSCTTCGLIHELHIDQGEMISVEPLKGLRLLKENTYDVPGWKHRGRACQESYVKWDDD